MAELRPYLLNGARRAGELIEAMGVDRATLMRAYDREADQILRFGRARRTRYAARRVLHGLQTDTFPAFRVDETGKLNSAGELITLEATESVWLPDDSVIDGLPAELHDIAPKGFLGRSYVRHHSELGLPQDVGNWSDHHVLLALTRRGEDLPGNLVIGRESFDRFQTLRHPAHAIEDFPRLSENAIAGEHVGSSAGGKQPKFTAFIDGQHRIVKFATDATDNARRWRDLLLLEHIALRTLRDAGINAARSAIIDLAGLRCLVLDRIDRIGEMGRRAVVSLAAADGELGGSWTDSAGRLQRRGDLSEAGVNRIALLDAFAALIANTDRHHYNVLLYPGGSGHEVAEAFDQLPMAYAPPASGYLRNVAINQPNAAVNTFEVWEQARSLASEFWRRAGEQDLTESMREIVQSHCATRK